MVFPNANEIKVFIADLFLVMFLSLFNYIISLNCVDKFEKMTFSINLSFISNT